MTESSTTKERPPKVVSASNIKMLGIDIANSLSTLRIIGYGLIALWLLDVIALLYPLQLLDPVWGFQILGQLVERVGVLLIGLGLILLGDVQQRQKWEIPLLKATVRIILFIAFAYFSLIPLGLGNTVRIARLTSQQVTAEAQMQISSLSQYYSEVANTQSADRVQQFIAQFGNRPSNNSVSLIELKQQAQAWFKSQIKELQSQTEPTIARRKSSLIKRSDRVEYWGFTFGIYPFIAVE